MHLVTFILLFIFGSIAAACRGDWSGIEAIGKFILYAAVIIGVACLVLNPVLLIVAIVIIVFLILVGNIK